MIFLLNPEHDPAYNLALEELLCSDCPDEVLMLWRNAPAVIVGRNQNTLAEIAADFVAGHNIKVVRRITGGGAVYHDLGNVNYSLIVNGRNPNPDSFARFARPVVDSLRELGVPAEFSGRNDITVDGRKVSGSAQTCLARRTLFHGTLLFDVDMATLESALSPGAAKIAAKGIKSVRARVLNLRERLPGLTVEQFIAAVAERLGDALKCGAPLPPPAEWRARAERLAAAKYRTPEWNYGSRFDFDCANSARFAGGEVRVELKISGNAIAAARFSGDFFGRRPAEELAGELLGVAFFRDSVQKALEKIDLTEYIQNVTRDELLSLICMGGKSHE